MQKLDKEEITRNLEETARLAQHGRERCEVNVEGLRRS